MFCPECKAEYRSGFTHCVDCDVDLVQELPEELTQSRQRLREVWSGDSESDCVELCQELKDAGISMKFHRFPWGLVLAWELTGVSKSKCLSVYVTRRDSW